MSACSPLEALTTEPDMSDLQLTVDTLQTSLRDAQRMVDELRAEVDVRRQELADVQIVRAQLEGRIREAERRLTEARHVIDLQREELSSARSEREQMGRTRAALQHQLKQLQKQLSKIEKQVMGGVSPTTMAYPRDGQPEVATIVHQQNDLPAKQAEETQVVLGPAIQVLGVSSVGDVPVVSPSATEISPLHVVVKPGDTLWRIARRYHTSVSRLMALNALSGDRIQVGQALWLTEPSVDEPEHGRM
ncbi:MAG: LysM peptidoglycan-binding domain-containing protein [Nitrospira sp.]|nr:LysM peptidoglycan-binding domain-containing protein [Nitrospira sp.]